MNRQQRRAAARAPRTSSGAAASFLAAVAHHQSGRLFEAEAGYRAVLAAQPDHADAAFNLGVALRQLGKIDDAIAAYAQALRIRPDYPEAHYNLGNALMVVGRPEAAIAAYAQALRLTPSHARATANLGLAYSDLGVVLLEQDRLDEASDAFAQALRAAPALARTHFNLGNLRQRQNRLDDAATAYTEALRLDPTLAEACSNLGNALGAMGRFDEALAAHRQGVALRPDQAEMHFNLGNANRDLGWLGDAADAYRQALTLDPQNVKAQGNLAIVLMSQGLLDEAGEAYARAITLEPDNADTFSNMLFGRNYDDRQTPAQLYAAHCEWNARFGQTALCTRVYSNNPAPDRRLKIGYVSADFRAHSVAYFLEPLFEAHDRAATEIYGYSDVARPDAVTARLRSLTDHWRDTAGQTDEALAEQISADNIDILIDLAGHTAHNRLRVFAAKPAPVQATWLGYANTTGLTAIDYRIVDDITDPPGEADAFASESLLRLPGSFLCFSGPKDAPAPASPPCLKNGFVTFGSFNNPAKISGAAFDVWAQLLTRLPSSRLLLKGKPFADAPTRAIAVAQFAKRGIAPERLQLMAWAPSPHLTLYDQIDIALDPFPYNGTTTTCEALWMGVPVVALRGDRHSARVGASILTHSKLTDWIAESGGDYIATALRLAADPQRLSKLRHSLRPQLSASGLCDSAGFARHMEIALRDVWRRWCASQPD